MRLGLAMKDASPDLTALRVFVTVAETGSFSAAAKRLGRAQSAISFIVRELEEELATSLFNRDGYRPRLSDGGRLLLPKAERLLNDAAGLVAAADALAGGVEAEVALVVDALFPLVELTGPLAMFARQYPRVQLKVFVEPLGAATDAVHDGSAALGILVALADRFEHLEPQAMSVVELVPVAALHHPLALAAHGMDGFLDPRLARDHLQLVLTDRTGRTAVSDRGVHSDFTWRLADLHLKRLLLVGGTGWGSLPRHLVADDLSAGRLVELRFEKWDGYDGPPRLRTAVVHKRGAPLGPAAAWLRARLAETAVLSD